MKTKCPPKRILLIDDDPNLTLLVKDYLEWRGYKVVTAEDGEEAIKILEEDAFDGDIFTGSTFNVVVCCIPTPGFDTGADIEMTKPFEPENLVTQVESALEKAARSTQPQTNGATPKIQVPFDVQLTPTEEKVVRFVAQGMKNSTIALALGVSQRTVESHVSNMLGKTGLHNRTELARWSMENRIA